MQQAYLEKIADEAYSFLRQHFPIISTNPINYTVRLSLVKEHENISYRCGNHLGEKRITFYSQESQDKIFMDDDKIKNELGVIMKRRNIYFISMIHELAELFYATIFNETPGASHLLAVDIELSALDILIKSSNAQDKKEFIKRKKARLRQK